MPILLSEGKDYLTLPRPSVKSNYWIIEWMNMKSKKYKNIFFSELSKLSIH